MMISASSIFSNINWASSSSEQYFPFFCLARQKLQWTQFLIFILERLIVSASSHFSEAKPMIDPRKASTLPFLTGLPEIPRILNAMAYPPKTLNVSILNYHYFLPLEMIHARVYHGLITCLDRKKAR
jgi:hypothetical protein